MQCLTNSHIPAVRLTCIACFCQFLSQFLTDFDKILQGLFLSHAATTVKFSSKNIMYTRRQINQDHMISGISQSIPNRFSSNFANATFYSNPNGPENFVKLYNVFQKLDHLTCNELKLRRPFITSLN